ncbi:MAG: alanine/glycine:cation symporter family protein [Gammaproteobacteria bacterium]
MLEQIESIASLVSNFVWGEYLLIPLLSVVGIYLTTTLRGMPWFKLASAFRLLMRKPDDGSGEISPRQALMTAMSATIGTGNIAGVATAIYFGGPGAVFWMWTIALFGMATKYSEAVVAVKFRQVDGLGQYVGGPMYYIKNGLGKRWRWMATSFAFFGMIAAFGIGNMVQSNSVADALGATYDIDKLHTGIAMALLVGVVILGGIHRIAEVVGKVVPAMAFAYISCTLVILTLYRAEIPGAFELIFNGAFTGTAAGGGFLGASIWMAIRFGVARGIFSNESGLGSAAIAHGAAKTNEPVAQGMVAMLGTFIDTIVICSLTALVLIVTGAWSSGENGAAMSTLAFATALTSGGDQIVSIGLAIFAFTTIIGWSYYGERCAAFLFGVKIIPYYRLIWVTAVLLGALIKLDLVWTLADIFNGLMALPNLVALLLLSPVILSETRHYFLRNSRNPL